MRSRVSRQEGFSFIELVVVMLVLGVLAAIALPAFAGQRGKGHDADAKQMVRVALTTLEAHFQESDGYALSASDLRSQEPALSSAGGLEVSAAGATYRVAIQSDSGTTFGAEGAAGAATRFCSPAGAGGCPASGRW